MVQAHFREIILAGSILALMLLASSSSPTLADDCSNSGAQGSITVDTVTVPDNAACILNTTQVVGLRKGQFAILQAGDDKKPKLVAHDDLFTFTGDQISIPAPGILENDQLSDESLVEVVLVRPPQQGAVILGQLGDFVYQAQSGYFGEDSFEYKLRSGKSKSEFSRCSSLNDRPGSSNRAMDCTGS